MAGSLQLCLETAAAHATAGREAEARKFYEQACRMAQEEGSAADPLERACAVLTYANRALQEGRWPLLQGKAPDELLAGALETARGAVQRSRALEGQLLMVRSKALFARPGKDAACLDAAMQARFEAAELLREASVGALPWTVRRARSLLEKLKASQEGQQLLSENELCAQLRRSLGGGEEAEEEVSALFDHWASPGPEGTGDGLALTDFLQRFLAIAEKLGRAVDVKDCSAPCEGGLPEDSSELEKELVALVSRGGAGGWEVKAKTLRGKGLTGADGSELTAASLEALWGALAPKIQKVIDADAPMACGHSCSTCPTRHDCQVHAALKDIEDL